MIISLRLGILPDAVDRGKRERDVRRAHPRFELRDIGDR